MGLTPVANDRLATVVTTLEMRERPRARPLPSSSLRLVRWHAPEPERYRTLFRRVGAPWLWFSRLALDDTALIAATHRDRTQVHAVLDRQGVEVGMLELTHPEDGWCALDYFGVVPELTGQGHGRWLMALTMQLAWRPGVSLVRVNTCTLDHPRALGFYRAHGFVAVKRTVETFADPRVLGLLPADAAPQVPLLANRR
ncbi:GNAT family N-acetyltransferase [Sphingomonas sp.]|jgi:GNAT superfamily N-acetyltransferase|uniref:GNAT family N-acetyltransferase n=1 Tax=Sphingomonas sp. TaxID=28214 RepID=UPI002D7EFD34|nr:GNAT family N-acetyltransferase [Sphingomonas sp.]HEU0044124.1 GNAT family N-acetyltransferase [Sphingomonas sp.]